MFRWSLDKTIFLLIGAALAAGLFGAFLLLPVLCTVFIDFCVAGRVPATDIYLDPVETLRLSIIISVIGVITILSRDIYRLGRLVATRRRTRAAA